MTTVVLGASGATGKNLVEELLKMGQKVKVIVRPSSIFLMIGLVIRILLLLKQMYQRLV